MDPNSEVKVYRPTGKSKKDPNQLQKKFLNVFTLSDVAAVKL